MKTIYKGKVSLLSQMSGTWDLGKGGRNVDVDYSDKVKQYIDKLTYEELQAMNIFLKGAKEKEIHLKPTGMQMIFQKMFSGVYFAGLPVEKAIILYEKVIDENGISYAKELYTGLIFPIFKDNSQFEKSEYCLLKEFSYSPPRLRVKKKLLMDLPTMDKCEAIIIDNAVADLNEVENYKTMFNNVVFSKRKIRDYKEKIEKLYNMNVFNQEIVEKKPEKAKRRQQQSQITLVMDNIEFLLMKLGQCNRDLYNKYKQEYDAILNSEGDVLTINPLTLSNLLRLEANLELDLLSSKGEASSILEYLEKLKKEYLTNFLVGKDKKTTLTIKELDRINELFLKVKDRYNYREQRSVLKSIAFIYLLELKENIDLVSLDELVSSYVNDHLKSILINIDALKQVGLIKSNLLIDLNQELSLANILEIIKDLDFVLVTNEDVSEYVKRIEF